MMLDALIWKTRFNKKLIYLLITFFFLSCTEDQKKINQEDQKNQNEHITVVNGDRTNNSWKYFSGTPNVFYNKFVSEAFELLEERAEKVAGIKSLDQWKKRQFEVKEVLKEVVGTFPERTPLNPQVIRTIKKEGYRIEHIIFESQPEFYIPSALFIPDGVENGAPTILFVNGHTKSAFRDELYQQVILNLVLKGFIVFTYDPTGQGERLQYYDEKSEKSKIGGATSEHFHAGNQAFIAGSSLANSVIWDGIRAIDYLVSRKEVDPERLGITGHSGGGTQSAYISAFDSRIYASAPSNFITSLTRLLQSIGPQDAEQNLYKGIFYGLDHADLLSVRAPKPTLVLTTSMDFFSIQGARETTGEVSRIYEAYNQEDNFGMVEDNDVHTYTRKNREALYDFFQKHLRNPGSAQDIEVEFLKGDDLQITSTGQIATEIQGKNLFDLNFEEAKKEIETLKKLRKTKADHISTVLNVSKELSGYQDPKDSIYPIFTGAIKRENYLIERYFIKGDGDYIIPFLLYKPDKPTSKALIYLNPDGKSTQSGTGGELEWLVNDGLMVLAPDLIGYGETGLNSKLTNSLWYAAMLVGRSLTGVWANDLTRLTFFLKEQEEINDISGMALKDLSPALLHAAAYNKLINTIVLREPYISYSSIVENEYYNPNFYLSAVPGALKHYDLPDLAASLAPRKLFILGPTDGKGNILDSGPLEKEVVFIKDHYQFHNASDKLKIIPGSSNNDKDLILDWIR